MATSEVRELGAIATGAHLVQLYDDELQLGRSIARYFDEGLRDGEGALMVARPTHFEITERALRARGFDAAALRAAGRFAALDAPEVLCEIVGSDGPDPSAFEEVVGTAVRAAMARAPGGRVRVYGELVDLLWQSGRLEAALQVERLWTAFMRRRALTLLCGYRMDVLSPALDERSLSRTCEAHSHVLIHYEEGRLERAVRAAMDHVLGAARSQALQPLIAVTRRPGVRLPVAESTLLWIRRNLPSHAPGILAQARARYFADALR